MKGKKEVVKKGRFEERWWGGRIEVGGSGG